MSLPIVFISTFIVVCLGYKYYRLQQIRKSLYWMKIVPGWPIIGNVFDIGSLTDALANILKLLKNHGKMIFVDFVMQPVILTSDYEFLEFLLGTTQIMEKSDEYRYLQNWLGTGLLNSAGEKWKSRRKLLTPAFHFSILKNFIKVFESSGDVLVQKLLMDQNKDIDIYPYINLFTLDVICESAMGINVGAQNNEENEYVRNVRRMCRIGIDRSSSILKRFDLLYPLSFDYYTERKIVKKLHQTTESVISNRKEKILASKVTSNQNDDHENYINRKEQINFIDILLKCTDETGAKMDINGIREEVTTFLFEGHDTTSSAISFTLFLLANHPEVQAKVLQEQELIFDENIYDSCTFEKLQNMKYLDQVIKESLRLYPPVPLYGRKTNEDIEYKGNIIPKGTNIVIYSFGVLRDPDNFSNPEKFDPSRFENYEAKKPFSFIPFSAGPRNCIGQRFAMLEIKNVVSKLIRHFELKPTSVPHNMILIPEAILKSQNGVKIMLEKREYSKELKANTCFD